MISSLWQRYTVETIIRLMVWLFLLIMGMHIAHLFIYHYGGGPYLKRLDVNYTKSIPTYISTVLFLVAAWQLWGVYRSGQALLPRPWLVLSVIFVLCAVDEILALHNKLSDPTRKVMQDHAGLQPMSDWDLYLHWGWVIPGILFVSALGLYLLRWLLYLPGRVAIIFISSAILFLSGAIAMEMLGGPRIALFGRDDYLYMTYTTIEESLEFLGLMLFNVGLWYYGRSLILGSADRASAAAPVSTNADADRD